MEQTALDLARTTALRLGEIDGVVAVALGGSWVRGAADAGSDIDLGVYYYPDAPPALDRLDSLAAELDDRHGTGLVTDFHAWGLWINGGGWLTIGGQRVDWLYRDLAAVGKIIQRCSLGVTRCYYQPGHPHGFHEHIYLGEVALCVPLYDPDEVVGRLKAATDPYPPALRRALVGQFMWEAGFALETSRKAASRGDAFYVAGGLFRAVACLVQVLFALNERYWINEKGAVAAVAGFPLHPEGWAETVTQALGAAGTDAPALLASLDAAAGLVERTQALCADAGLL